MVRLVPFFWENISAGRNFLHTRRVSVVSQGFSFSLPHALMKAVKT